MDSSNEAGREGERRRVLAMLQRGQISAAEADELLAALEGRSAVEESQPPSAASQPVAQRRRRAADGQASMSGRTAVAVGLARALAKTVAGLSIALGRVVGTLARLFGRAPAARTPRDR